jgi:hypothetical protein
MLHAIDLKSEELSIRHIHSVRCPMCAAKPKQKCTLTTGHPSTKTHLARRLAAAKVSRPENSSFAALRFLRALTSRGLRVLFQHK